MLKGLEAILQTFAMDDDVMEHAGVVITTITADADTMLLVLKDVNGKKKLFEVSEIVLG